MHALAVSSNPDTPVSMTSLEIADLTGKQHKDVLYDTRKMLSELGLMSADFSANVKVPMPRGGFRNDEIFKLPKRETLILVSGYDTVLRAKVVDRVAELEAKRFNPGAMSRLDILKLAMESEEGRIKAEAERDLAVATKALIGSKREATAMATAAVAKKEVLKLKDSMGEATHRAAVIAVERATKVKTNTYDWRVLRNFCLANELDFGKVWNPGLQMEVNSYPAEAWMRCHGVDLVALFGKKAA